MVESQIEKDFKALKQEFYTLDETFLLDCFYNKAGTNLEQAQSILRQQFP